ncbi:MAG: glutaredoxin domain-containing protein, partial [Aquiluna sp.]
CPWCVRAKKLLELMGVEYEEVSGKHPDWPTAPYIILDGNPIGGFTELANHARS